SNDWRPDRFEIAPTTIGPGGIFPTMFQALRQQRPSAVIGIFHDWDGFANLVERGVPTVIEHPRGAAQTVQHAASFLKARAPDCLFIPLDHVDDAGHTHGHGSPEYVAAVEEADRLTGLVLDALREAGLRESTMLLLTADHGGVGKKHGQATMA